MGGNGKQVSAIQWYRNLAYQFINELPVPGRRHIANLLLNSFLHVLVGE